MVIVEKRAVISGEIVEIFEYEKGYSKGYNFSDSQKLNIGRIKDDISPDYDLHRQQVLQRSKSALIRLINANIGAHGDASPKFLTLTFADNVTDIDFANNEFKKFIKRLNYEVFGVKGGFLKYSCVIEFQKRGAIHYHLVLYNLPYAKPDMLSRCWRHGFIKINRINKVDNVGAYVSKYMTKEHDDKRLHGRKSHFHSKGLNRPVEILDKRKVEQLAVALPSQEMRYSVTYQSELLGSITYRQYNLSQSRFQAVGFCSHPFKADNNSGQAFISSLFKGGVLLDSPEKV